MKNHQTVLTEESSEDDRLAEYEHKKIHTSDIANEIEMFDRTQRLFQAQ